MRITLRDGARSSALPALTELSCLARGAALRLAQDAAGGQGVRIGGGSSTMSGFLRDDLTDFMLLAIVAIVLGTGVRTWADLAGTEGRFGMASIGTASGPTRQLRNRECGECAIAGPPVGGGGGACDHAQAPSFRLR